MCGEADLPNAAFVAVIHIENEKPGRTVLRVLEFRLLELISEGYGSFP